MGLLDWFSGRSAAKKAGDSGGAGNSSYLGGASDTFAGGPKLQTFPGVLVRPPGAVESDEMANKIKTASLAAANRAQTRKNERNAYRELLHQVVREAMVRNGMLSSSYKFKVLSLDSRGLSFLVMMDLPLEFGAQVARLAAIEHMIINNAKTRHQLQVSAVYWRIAPVPVHEEFKAAAAAAAAAALPAAVAAPAPAPQPPLQAVAVAAPGFAKPHTASPVLADEVAALKQALAAGAIPGTSPGAKLSAVSAAMAAARAAKAAEAAALKDKSGSLLLTGYEETEMPDPDEIYPQLGNTQYGDMR